jgi:hypothetical protein
VGEAARIAETRHVAVGELHEAPLLVLHPPHMPRCDSTSPVLRPAPDTAIVFVSHHKPIGHSYRREGMADLSRLGPPAIVRILDDPAPLVGKWIEAVWPDPDGRLFGWYHAEEPAPGPRPLFVPHVGRLMSEDGGRSWRHLGVLLRAPPALADPHARNGFLAGGYGDFCVLPDRERIWLYIAVTSYVADPRRQGVALLRHPLAARDAPPEALALRLECHDGAAWRPLAPGEPPRPWLPARRDWREADPDSFWGPAIHWNRDLGRYVMLLNRTRAGTPAFRQDGIHLSSGERLDRPEEWDPPRRLTFGGSWYPQVVGLGPRDSDTEAGSGARFFMAGRSAWRIRLRLLPAGAPVPEPLRLSWEGRRADGSGT